MASFGDATALRLFPMAPVEDRLGFRFGPSMPSRQRALA
jgi:hypothetical protein